MNMAGGGLTSVYIYYLYTGHPYKITIEMDLRFLTLVMMEMKEWTIYINIINTAISWHIHVYLEKYSDLTVFSHDTISIWHGPSIGIMETYIYK